MTGHTPWSEIRRNPPKTGIIQTYALVLQGPFDPGPGNVANDADLLHRRFPEFLREAEENLTGLLPEGWWVEIHEWDEGVDDA